MWSSWPWVRTIASTRSWFSRRYSKSGNTMSMPGISVCGNESPASIRRRRSSSSTTAMLRPTSPTPPRKERWAGTFPEGPSDEAGILERSPDRLALLRVGGNERQPRRARGTAEELERRLQRDRVARDEQRREQRRELLVHLAGCGDVARGEELHHLAYPVAHDVRRDRNDADGAERHRRERRPVVAAIHLEIGRRLRDQPRETVEVSGRILDADHVRDLREREQCPVLYARSGPSRDVVGEDRQVRRGRDALEMRDDPALWRLVVIRGDDQEAVGSRPRGGLGEFQCLLRRVGARAADHLAVPLRGLDDGAVEIGLLEMGQRRSPPRAP